MTEDEDDKIPVALPVSPSTGLDPEVRQFMSRVMAGYEAAHRTIADMARDSNKSTVELHKAVHSAIAMQMRAAEEREELISKRHKRDLEAAAAQQQQATAAELKGDVRSILMLVAKKYFGIPLTGNDSHGLNDLLSTMTPDQVQSVIETGHLQLTSAQQQLLAETIISIGDAEAKKLEPKAEAAE